MDARVLRRDPELPGEAADIDIADSPRELKIAIRDRGPGIPEPELERVFEPFYRLEASRNKASGGTGLGLSIARAIVDAHGGTISVASEPGDTTFEVRLPARSADPA